MPQRAASLAIAGLFGLVLSACAESAAPCSECPALDGSYPMVYQEESRSTDCAVVPAPSPPPELKLTQVGSSLRSRTGALELVGTVYDTYDFTLAGASSPDGGPDLESISMRGHFIPPSSANDGGAQIRGTCSMSSRRQATGGARSCSLELSFTSTRR